jgi:hypothetical protein
VANEAGETVWLAVIGKALAYLCVQDVSKNDPKRVGTLSWQFWIFWGILAAAGLIWIIVRG